MIVDNSFIMRNNIKKIIEEAGMEVVAEADNGKTAVMKYMNYRPDIITMDISMPVMDGIEATKKIIEKDPDAKIVIISSFSQKDKVYEAVKNGANHFIIKPFTMQKVVNVINEVL